MTVGMSHCAPVIAHQPSRIASTLDRDITVAVDHSTRVRAKHPADISTKVGLNPARGVAVVYSASVTPCKNADVMTLAPMGDGHDMRISNTQVENPSPVCEDAKEPHP